MNYLDLFISMILSVFIWSAVTITFVNAKVFAPLKYVILKITPRIFEENVAILLHCSQCFGFWVGVVGSFIVYPVWITNIGGPVITTVLHGFCISLSSLLIDRLIYGKETNTS